MNKTKIEWCDYTWNPITGCTAGCPYCYARKIAVRFAGHFRPTFHPDRLGGLSDVKRPKRIFVGSMGDMFDPLVKNKWRVAAFQEMGRVKWHTYFILTKQPQNISDIGILDRYGLTVYFGVTITGPQDKWRIDKLKEMTPPLMASGRPMQLKRFISFEPLLEDAGLVDLNGIDWVIVGQQTKPDIPAMGFWIEPIIKKAKQKEIPIFLKNNLKWYEKIQEFPR